VCARVRPLGSVPIHLVQPQLLPRRERACALVARQQVALVRRQVLFRVLR